MFGVLGRHAGQGDGPYRFIVPQHGVTHADRGKHLSKSESVRTSQVQRSTVTSSLSVRSRGRFSRCVAGRLRRTGAAVRWRAAVVRVRGGAWGRAGAMARSGRVTCDAAFDDSFDLGVGGCPAFGIRLGAEENRLVAAAGHPARTRGSDPTDLPSRTWSHTCLRQQRKRKRVPPPRGKVRS